MMSRLDSLASISYQVGITMDVPLNPNGGPSVGIDLGVKTLVMLSDGTTYANSRTVRKCERRRRRIQRQLARKTNGSKRRDRCRMRLAMAYAHERNVRMDYLDENARKSRTMAYLNARSYAKAAVDAYRKASGDVKEDE